VKKPNLKIEKEKQDWLAGVYRTILTWNYCVNVVFGSKSNRFGL